jgi:hypothetical protein
MTVAVLRSTSATHEFRPRCLKTEIERLLDERGDFGRGLLVHALVALLHDIDHDRCPRCQGPLRTVEDEVPIGSRVTSCRCIPLCAACGACETSERSVGGHSSVLDWYASRAVRHDLERDLEGIDDASRTFVIDLTQARARAHLNERSDAPIVTTPSRDAGVTDLRRAGSRVSAGRTVESAGAPRQRRQM